MLCSVEKKQDRAISALSKMLETKSMPSTASGLDSSESARLSSIELEMKEMRKEINKTIVDENTKLREELEYTKDLLKTTTLEMNRFKDDTLTNTMLEKRLQQFLSELNLQSTRHETKTLIEVIRLSSKALGTVVKDVYDLKTTTKGNLDSTKSKVKQLGTTSRQRNMLCSHPSGTSHHTAKEKARPIGVQGGLEHPIIEKPAPKEKLLVHITSLADSIKESSNSILKRDNHEREAQSLAKSQQKLGRHKEAFLALLEEVKFRASKAEERQQTLEHKADQAEDLCKSEQYPGNGTRYAHSTAVRLEPPCSK
jgi:hypothetical protein